MGRKKNRNRRPAVRSTDSSATRTNVLLEDIQLQVRMVSDGVISSRESIERKLDERFEKVDRDIAVLKVVARQHSTDLKDLKNRMGRVEDRLDRMDLRFDGVDSRLDSLNETVTGSQSRIAALEKKAG
jgi:chromosome segregation ATPase